MGFACDTLKRSRGVFPFGCQWVQSGRTAAYYGSVARIGVKPNTALAYQTGKVFAAGQVTTLGQLVTILDQRLQTQPGLQAAWCTLQTYHIIGNPLQSFLSTC